MLKRIFLIVIAFCLFATAGCTSGVPKADKDGNLVVYSFDEIPIEGYYAKTGQAFSPLYRDGANFNAAPRDNERLATRHLWIVGEEHLIPIVKNSAESVLIYYSQNARLTDDVIIERMGDRGYTLGIKFVEYEKIPQLGFSQNSLPCEGSNAEKVAQKLENTGAYELDTINGTPLTASLLDANGVIPNLQKDAYYLLEGYKGTIFQNIKIQADVHYFVSEEIYTIKQSDIQRTKSGYAIIQLPDDLPEGLYCVNGKGFFLYQKEVPAA